MRGERCAKLFKRAFSTLVVAAVLVLCRCIPNAPLHVLPDEIASGRVPPESWLELVQSDVSLATIEFDDQGRYWNRQSVEAAMDHVSAQMAEGAIVVVYAHGWNNNGAACNSNRVCFREALRYVSSHVAQDRPVLGIYLAWRGQIGFDPLTKYLSFWNRKAAAERIGKADVLSFLVGLDRLRRKHEIGDEESFRLWKPDDSSASARPQTQLVVIGHSFGAAMLYSGIAGALHSRLVARVDEWDPADFTGYGDLVVLVNPAFEAAQYERLRNAAVWETGAPVLVTLASENDGATKLLFPLGRRFSTLFQTFRDSAQKELALVTAGNYAWPDEQRAVKECGTPIRAKRPNAVGCFCPWSFDIADAVSQAARRADVDTLCYGGYEVPSSLLDRPLSVVRVPSGLIDGHGGFFNPRMVDFVTRLASDVRNIKITERRRRAVWIDNSLFPEDRFVLTRKVITTNAFTLDVRMATTKHQYVRPAAGDEERPFDSEAVQCRAVATLRQGAIEETFALAADVDGVPEDERRGRGVFEVPMDRAPSGMNVLILSGKSARTYLIPAKGAPIVLAGSLYFFLPALDLIVVSDANAFRPPGEWLGFSTYHIESGVLREYPRSRPPLEVYLDGQRLFYRLPVGIFELNLATGEREKRDRLPQQAIAVPPTFNNWTQRDCPAYGEVWDGYRGVEDLLRVLNRRNGS